MADWLPPKWPDYYQKPAIKKTAESLWLAEKPLISPEIWKVVIDTKTWVATIFLNWKTKEKTDKLNDTLKKDFIETLKQKTKNKDILDAIKNETLQIFNIPWKDKFAISLNGANLDYIFNKDWTEYFDYKWRRDDPIRYSAFRWITWIEEKVIWWINYIVVDWKNYKVFTPEYYNILIEKIDFLKNFTKTLKSIDFDKIRSNK